LLHWKALAATVDPVPPAPHSSLVTNLSILFIVTGVTLVCSALPPVRKAGRELFDRISDTVYGKPGPVRVSEPSPQVPVAEPAAVRKEIENFDLDIFAS
jgi:hypothetical protein